MQALNPSNLVIVIPFPKDEECDLDKDAKAMWLEFNKPEICSTIKGTINQKINSIQILHQEDQNYECTQNDHVILFAHGGKKHTNLVNNQGKEITRENAAKILLGIKADIAKQVYFMCCFSSLEGHIGDFWKQKYSSQNEKIYGARTDVSTFYSGTRRSITKVCSALQIIE
ncbi:hypothetical protein PN441_02580 [Spirulina major CS-329]|uniref:hypothetical protein n=1 Tax=Spirulina TaxID=1154 RepID=UPI00232EDAF8|nr:MULTISPECIES: hypothetical protein [Spirulina]MDB9495396.1 hypothetical protein [Spirulina subsalsa CS-330]MDB9501941.1 hypothetical protein [Spirulina major CS-329]